MESTSTSSLCPPIVYHCPTCQYGSSGLSRNLVVCIDGATRRLEENGTNVAKLYTHVTSTKDSKVTEQHKYYLSGIGARDPDASETSLFRRTTKEIYRAFELAYSWNIAGNIKDAYNWLVEKYRQGDRIYLFGFSRGGFQVRMLASMIHEVGLAKEKSYSELAYNHYRTFDPYKPETREKATEFRHGPFCWQGVKVHFVGTWDVVCPTGLAKNDVLVKASESASNACHVRHALALDERRVKFMPEYFTEINAQPKILQTSESALRDVKEVWFAGNHANVGGVQLSNASQMHIYDDTGDPKAYTPHAGKVPLQWMIQEATAHGLVFELQELTWSPEDVDHGRTNAMSFTWALLEVLPIRHQVSFGGTNKHKPRMHLFQPRSIIPGQQIHPSVLSGDLYMPHATLGSGIGIPTRRTSDGLWATGLVDESEMSRLSVLLCNPHKTLEHLETVLFLLDFGLSEGRDKSIPRLRWSAADFCGQSDLANFALTVIEDVMSDYTVSEESMTDARAALRSVLSSRGHSDLNRILYTLRFLTKHHAIRRRFVNDIKLTRDLVLAMEWMAKNSAEDRMFLLIADSMYHLICDDKLRDGVIEQLGTSSDETETGQSRLSAILDVKSPRRLMVSLKIIVVLARFQSDLCEGLKPRILELAKRGGGPVGPVAVEALVTMKEQITRDIDFAAILGYLDNNLPLLDVEVGKPSSFDNIDRLPPVLLITSSRELSEHIMHQLVLSIKSAVVHQRTLATLTLIRLCKNSDIRNSCLQRRVADIFVRQLEQQATSLLAAYALRMCLCHDMLAPDHLLHIAKRITVMLEKDWFDGVIGQVEGCDVFRGLMSSFDLKQYVLQLGTIEILMKKLEASNCHEARMSLLCLDVLGEENPLGLAPRLADSLSRLRHKAKIPVVRKGKLKPGAGALPQKSFYLQDRMSDSVETLVEIVNNASEDGKASDLVIDWLTGFIQHCVSVLEANGDEALRDHKYRDAIKAYSTALSLGHSSLTSILLKWARIVLVHDSVDVALAAAAEFKLPKSDIFRTFCDVLEGNDRFTEAIACFRQMRSELLEYTSFHDERKRWELGFQSRCREKLQKLANVGMDSGKYSEAAEHLTAILTLDPVNPMDILIERSKAHLLMRSWDKALSDADKVINTDRSYHRGYEMKHAALHGARRHAEAAEVFEMMLLKIKESPRQEIRKLHSQYVATRNAIQRTVRVTIEPMPRLLINVETGHLYDKQDQAKAFEALPVYELLSTMTTRLDECRIRAMVKEFYRYVMFSHRWEDAEPLLQHVENISIFDLKASSGNAKLQMFCLLVRRLGFRWAWSDTCCIDKRDNVVLQESLVAMFTWYRGSSLTIIYLYDVSSESQVSGSLRESIWNTRAWTYQEYVAAKIARFYTKEWEPYLGLTLSNHKESPGILSEMQQAAGCFELETTALQPGKDRVREKLFLASRRKTTLVEDAAYSLFGIFRVAIPVMYGERFLAVGRFLEHILTGSADVTVLAWTGTSGEYNSCLPRDLTVYDSLVPPHIPPSVGKADMDTIVMGLRSSLPDSSLIMELYRRLNELPSPSLASGRLKLPGISSLITNLVLASETFLGNGVRSFIYHAETSMFGDVEIKTTEDLTDMEDLCVFHPWIRSLFAHGNVRGGGAADKTTRALRLLASLKQPFGALLFASVADVEYKRVAADSLIMTQISEDASLDDLVGSICTIEIQ